ncbi:DNA (cytosine-5-)-methyltransferase, partial [Pseudomonas sp. MDMC224]
MKAISLFTGAGGLDYGFEAAGFETAIAVEMDKDAASTLRASRGWQVIEEDIHGVTSQRILKEAGLREGDADVLIGGPPCQPFSKASYWAYGDSKRLDDPRADTLLAYMRVVRDSLPRVFVLENVHGIAYSGKEEGLSLIFKIIEEINRERGVSYAPVWKVINAADYGVPQLRSRFFLVAHRDGRGFGFPEPTHAPIPLEEHLLNFGDLVPYTTAWDAIGEITPDPDEDLSVKGKWADLLPSIPEGENYLWHTPRGGGLPLFGWRTRYWNFLLKLAKNRPSWTIPASPGPATGPFHWSNRLLSVGELAALQTFPRNVHFRGSRLSVQRQIGNAVPSLLAEVIARAIARQLLNETLPQEPTLAVRLMRPIPDPEPVLPV